MLARSAKVQRMANRTERPCMDSNGTRQQQVCFNCEFEAGAGKVQAGRFKGLGDDDRI